MGACRLHHAVAATSGSEWRRWSRTVASRPMARRGSTAARAETLAALTSMGTATARQLGQAVPALDRKAATGARQVVRGNAGRAHAPAVEPRLRRRNRARPPERRGPIRSTHGRSLRRGSGASRSPARTSAIGAAELARGLRRPLRSGHARRSAVVGGLDGGHDARGARGHRRGRSGSHGRRCRMDSPRRAPTGSEASHGSRSCRRSIRRRWVGKNARGTSATSPSSVETVFDRNGNAGPTIWVDGRVVGGWAQRKSGEVAYALLADDPDEADESGRRRGRALA